ncbi:unnamed protein product [Chrysodeixis includens]|uniref:Uncharacterized protein n=1 Tax=Chrysodeixis includens TaxID=689277 RepID=A0A9P0BXB9_CHRIL|nr:unnamed protein product [Chrysodeixis includens]
MDCISVESEFIESLDFLSLPVKRLQNSREAFGNAFYNEPSNVHLLRGLRNKFSRRSHNSPKSSRLISIKPSVDFKTSADFKPSAASSTSLILKKTSERKILERYSVLSYTSLQQPADDEVAKLIKPDLKQNPSEKPLIKVTVIPRTDHVQTAKLLRKRRFVPKRVSSTTSNQENSVQTKNVYLIVAGRRREKIYEIKTTGSTKLSTDHDSHAKNDELPIKELSNFKHLIESLNMDRKKKKPKKGNVNSDAPQQTSLEWKGFPECENCFCAQTVAEDPDAKSQQKSRIKIFGQFGISEDDKYVLRYGASVNDKQVLSDVAQLTRDFSPMTPLGPFPKYTSSLDEDLSCYYRPQKESGIQADCDNDLSFEIATKDTIPSKESQGTQVNFNVQVATMTKEKTSRFSDKKIQCTCCAAQSSIRSDNKALKDCQSPLVIISVYPKQGTDDLENSAASNVDTYTSSQIIKTDRSTKKTTTETRKHNKPVARSRSPSPTKKPSKTKLHEDKLIENRLNKSYANEKKSPDRQSPDRKALKAIKDKIHEKDKLKQDVATRKPSKFNSTNATQAGRNTQVVVSNATQVSNKNRIASNATQVSARNRQNYTVSNATQVKSPTNIAPVKHNNVSVITPSKHPQIAIASNATQASKSTRRVVATNGTQISKNEYFTSNNATQVSKNPQSSNQPRKFRNQETLTAPAKVYKNEQTSETQPLQEKGTNTDHARTKKALVETYTKKLTEQMNQKDYMPARYDSSKITINIDGDNEYYDVLFNQDKKSTDLTVRKTLKDMGSQKCLEEEPSVSLERLLFMPSDEARHGMISGTKSPEKSLSFALYNNRSDDEPPLTKHVSRFSIRDSLEISHRREDKSNHNHNNIKNTQTCFTAQLTDTVLDETEFLAPIKHFTGDDCSICNPIERDKQIRELLGVEKSKFGSSRTLQEYNSTIDEHPFHPFQCIYRQECKKSQVTEINYEFQKLCPCFKKRRPKNKSFQNTAVQVRPNLITNKNDKQDTICPACNTKESKGSKQSKQSKQSKATKQSKNQQKSNDHNCCVSEICPNLDMYDNDEGEDNVHSKYDYAISNENKDMSFDSQNKSSIYQQLILNRNIQVFLQVEQFSKQKPIVLSRKQYDKVKKTIQKTICKEKKSNHDKRKKICHKCVRSEVSIGAVRTKNEKKDQQSNKLVDQEAQTDLVPCDNLTCRKENRKALKRKQMRQMSPDHSEDFSGDGPLEHYRKKENTKTRKGHAMAQESDAIPLKMRDQRLNLASNESSYTSTYSNFSGKGRARHRSPQEESPKHMAVDATDPCATPPASQSSDDDCVCCTPVRCEEVENELIAKWKREPRPEHKRERSPEQKRERSPERKRERSPDRKRERSPDRKRERSPDRKRERSPERHKDKKKVKEQNSEEVEVERRTELYEEAEKCCTPAEIKTMVLFNAEDAKADSIYCKQTGIDSPPRKTMSSVEVRYASVAYMKQVAYSSTDMGAVSNSSLPHINSFQTIFRGYRKSPTPNLGTSAYSLYSEDGLPSEHKSAKFLMEPRDTKPKKPFLRRLMSCLVMRSTRNSDLKLPTGPAPNLPSLNSSIDSYHISTSFGAVEVSSSIYDTSASFYSNHTILPVNSKIKRGFFSSVRGFLTNRKS